MAELSELAKGAGLSVSGLLNPKSTGYRQLKLDAASLDDSEAARLIGENPKIMYRPLLSDGKKVVVGFDAAEFAALLQD